MPNRTLTFAELQQKLEAISRLAGSRVAIGADDPDVDNYARVLEFGSVAGQPPWPSPGPRTVLAVDPASGTPIVVSTRAPQGFIRAQVPAFAALVANELAATVDWLDDEAAQAYIVDATRQAAQAVLARIQASVPRDSGRLAASLVILADG